MLYVALANADMIVGVDLKSGLALQRYLTSADGRGTVVQAIAVSPDGKRLYAASGSLDAVAVFEVKESPKPHTIGSVRWADADFIPTEWYPTALAIVGNDLLIATAKGQGSGPNNGQNTLKEIGRAS